LRRRFIFWNTSQTLLSNRFKRARGEKALTQRRREFSTKANAGENPAALTNFK
jgi:hypothetical protein